MGRLPTELREKIQGLVYHPRRTMRILHLLASPYWSGPAENIAELARAQRALGHDVQVAIDRRRHSAPAEELAAPRFEALGLLGGHALELSVKSPPWSLITDGLRLRAERADVVHAHFSHDHWLARVFAARTAVLVRSIHAPRSLRRLRPRADAYTVPSASQRPRIRHPRVAVLPALVPDRFRPPEDRRALRASLGLEGEPLVGMVSTFQRSRRHEVGIAAFADLYRRLPKARLVLVGDGALGQEMRAQVAALGISEAVRFAGYQGGDAFVRHLQALDQVWILGLGNDWSARAAAQANACGVAIVATEEGALPDWADRCLPSVDRSSVVGAALEVSHRPRVRRSAEEVAGEVLRLYEEAAR